MTITWLDRLRGQGQGRTIPQGFTAPDGQRVFVLGGDGIPEPAVLSDGDFTEVKQVVNLANWDLVAATMDTIGQVMGQHQPAPGFPDDYPSLWHFNYDIGLSPARNLVVGGFNLQNQGDIEIANESYSPAATRCRQIPVGSTTAQLLGANTPNWYAPDPMFNYTFQAWIDFDAAAHPTSWGIDPTIFKCVDGVPKGVEFGLAGAFGPPHEWIPIATHYNGGFLAVTFPGFKWDSPNPGWTLLSFVFDWSLPSSQHLRLYVNDNPTPYASSPSMTAVSNGPAAGTPITVGHPDLWGRFDEMRFLAQSLTPSEIAASHSDSTSWPTPVDFQWLMQILINGENYGERVVRPSERRRWTDFKAPVRHLKGDAEVAFRLTLQEI